MSALVVDASVAVKWFVSQDASDQAERILASAHVLHAPDLMRIEAANGFWKHVTAGHIQLDQARQAIGELSRVINVWHGSADLLGPAFTISHELGHPIYDCIYLALASALDAPMVTADARLLARVAESTHSRSCVALEEFSARIAQRP